MPERSAPRATILHTEHSDGWGGQEIRIVSEARGVIERGYRVLIATRPESNLLARARAAGIATFPMPMARNIDPVAITRLINLIRRERVDLVNTHSSIDAWLGGIAARLGGVRLVRTRHVSKRIRAHALNFVHQLPDLTITTGTALRQQFLADTGVEAARVVSIPTGVDIEHFAPSNDRATLRARLGLPVDATVIASVGVLRRAKRHELLVQTFAAMARRAGLYLVIAGEGGQRAAIEAKIEALGLAGRAYLLGHVEDVRWVFAGADVVASASYGMEGVPQALAQALAMARPVVATDDGAIAELVRDEETGLLVAPEDCAALANAIDRMLADPALADRLRMAGRAHVLAHYSRDAMIDAVVHVYEQLLP